MQPPPAAAGAFGRSYIPCPRQLGPQGQTREAAAGRLGRRHAVLLLCGGRSLAAVRACRAGEQPVPAAAAAAAAMAAPTLQAKLLLRLLLLLVVRVVVAAAPLLLSSGSSSQGWARLQHNSLLATQCTSRCSA